MSETLFLYSRISCSLEILLDLMKASTPTEEQAQCEHQHKTSRLRGGGAGKVCSLAYLPRGLRASVCNHLPCRTASLPCSGASFASVRLSLPYGLHSSLTYSFVRVLRGLLLMNNFHSHTNRPLSSLQGCCDCIGDIICTFYFALMHMLPPLNTFIFRLPMRDVLLIV